MPRIWRKRIELDEYNRDENGYMRGDRPFTKILVHYVFTPKYRFKLVDYDGLPELVEAKIKEVCENRGWPIHNIAVETDHVHVLIQITHNDKISYVAQIIKGNVSKVALEQYPEIATRFKKRVFWGKKYSAISVGHSDFEKTMRYIEKQGVSTL